MSTIAAISTATGIGGIGIVRISGPDAIKIADTVFRSADGIFLSEVKGYNAKFGKVYDDDVVIDEAIAIVFISPHSYTGENVVEISCHGGIYIVRRVLDLVIKKGARLAEPGEFTKRAFLNGKMELSKAESVINLISSQGELSRKLAVSGMEGAINSVINMVKTKLVDIISELDVWADYPDDDTIVINRNKLSFRIQEVIKQIFDVTNTHKAARYINQGIKITVVGSPNVGKSSLVNLLLGYSRAIVTDIPGTTRDIIKEQIMIGDIPVSISDTAGIRDTDDVIERIGIDKTVQCLEDSDIVFVVFDASRKLKQEDINIDKIVDKNKAIAIVNKTDLDVKIDMNCIEKMFSTVISISANTGNGIENLKKTMYDFIGMENLLGEHVVPTSERQFEILERTVSQLKNAKKELELGVTLDAIAVLIQDALTILTEISGENVSDEVINNIFAKFCVGK